MRPMPQLCFRPTVTTSRIRSPNRVNSTPTIITSAPIVSIPETGRTATPSIPEMVDSQRRQQLPGITRASRFANPIEARAESYRKLRLRQQSADEVPPRLLGKH